MKGTVHTSHNTLYFTICRPTLYHDKVLADKCKHASKHLKIMVTYLTSYMIMIEGSSCFQSLAAAR